MVNQGYLCVKRIVFVKEKESEVFNIKYIMQHYNLIIIKCYGIIDILYQAVVLNNKSVQA